MTARAPLSAGTRAAGIVLALGYLLGIVPGPLVAAIGGLALVTFGRALLVDRAGELKAGVALALIAGAVGVAALRWGSLELGDVRGVQGVLGPTVLVAPEGAATACWLAASGAVLALGVWLTVVRPVHASGPPGRWGWIFWSVEAIAGALAIVSVFWGPALVSPSAGEEFASGLGVWASAAAVALVPALLLAWLLPKRKGWWTWATLSLSAGAVVAGAALVASYV